MVKKLLLSMLALLAIIACDSDDSTETTGSLVDKAVVGSWVITQDNENENYSETLTLKANGTFNHEFTMILKKNDDIEKYGYTKREGRVEGKLTTANGVMTTVPTKAYFRKDEHEWTDGTSVVRTEIWKYTVSDNNLMVTDEEGESDEYVKYIKE